MKDYKVTIVNSTKPLTGKQKVMVKDFTNAQSIDELTNDSSLVLKVDNVITCEVHNPASEDKDYMKYVIIDENGNKFVTGSESAITSLIDIIREMDGEDEDYSVEFYKKESKNYKGKSFITCSII